MGNRQIEAVVVRNSELLGLAFPEHAYSVVRLAERHTDKAEIYGARYALARIGDLEGSEIVLHNDQCIAVPPSLGSEEALLGPPLAVALSVWDQLHLELGEAAVYTDGNPLSNLVGQVAIWRGGCPVVKLQMDSDGQVQDGVERIDLMMDPDEIVNRIKGRIVGKAGVGAVDLSGRPETIEMLLDVMPRWGRLMIAGRTQQLLTVDFYNDVHRKGLLFSCRSLDPSNVFNEEEESRIFLGAAFRILQNKAMAAICSRVMCLPRPACHE